MGPILQRLIKYAVVGVAWIGGITALVVYGLDPKGAAQRSAERVAAETRFHAEVCPLVDKFMIEAKKANVIYKEDPQRQELFVNPGYYLQKIDQKKVMVENWAKCKTAGGASVIDSRSGRVVATYGPLSGFSSKE